MLRYDFMKSDFHPVFLLLGDNRDLRRLAALLREYEKCPAETELATAIPDSFSRSSLRLVPEEGLEGNYGLKLVTDNEFRWGLNAWQAGQLAERLEALMTEGNKSGSEIFEFGVSDEIPIKVSKEEFTEDFIVQKL